MTGIVVRRSLMMVLVLIGITIVTFLLSRVVPTDPARLIAGPRASAEGVATVRREYGLDLPLWQQYTRYMSGLMHLDFGKSFHSLRPVAQDLVDFLPATVELTLAALIFAVIVGNSIGIISAVWQNSLADHLARLIAIGGLSTPAFWLGILAQLLFYQSLGWLPYGGRLGDEVVIPPPITGLITVDSLLSGNWATFSDALRHLILPALVLGIEPMAILARIMRTSLLEVLREQYILAARAKGLIERLVIWKHAIRNALLAVVTMIGLQIGYLLGGSILVETVFSWPGIGRYSARAIVTADYNAVMGVTLIIAAIYLVTNFMVDMMYAWLDPRIRY